MSISASTIQVLYGTSSSRWTLERRHQQARVGLRKHGTTTSYDRNKQIRWALATLHGWKQTSNASRLRSGARRGERFGPAFTAVHHIAAWHRKPETACYSNEICVASKKRATQLLPTDTPAFESARGMTNPIPSPTQGSSASRLKLTRPLSANPPSNTRPFPGKHSG